MADVTLPWRSTDGTPDSARGQLFLIGALALAVLLITVALLLNTAIYTENLATRSDSADSAEVLGYQTIAQTHATAELKHTNREHNTSNDALVENYTASIETWDETAATHQAAEGRVTAMTVEDTTNGTRIVQDDSQEFTDASNSSDWDVAQDANVRNYTMTVNGSLANSNLGNHTTDSVFHAEFSDSGGTTWTVYIYDGTSGRVNVTVENNGSVVDTRAMDYGERIDITNGTLAGESWSALQFFDDLNDGYDISHENGDEARGTYSLVVDRSISSIDQSPYYDDDSGDSPYVTPALYDAEFGLIYESSKTYYEAQYRVAPGEPDV